MQYNDVIGSTARVANSVTRARNIQTVLMIVCMPLHTLALVAATVTIGMVYLGVRVTSDLAP